MSSNDENVKVLEEGLTAKCRGCGNKPDLKYINGKKSSEWGENKYSDYKYYWNCCEKCFKEDDDSEDEDDGSNTCYKVETRTQKTFVMSGGHGDWFNYVVVFDDDGEQKELYIESKNGLELCEDQRLVMTFNKHGDERIKCVYDNYELNEDKEESWIYIWDL